MSTAPRLGLVFNGNWFAWVLATSAKYRDYIELVYIHELDEARIAHLPALAVPFNAPMRHLAARRLVLDRFLARGGRLFFEGNSVPAWLDGVRWEDRPVNNYWWLRDPDHPPIGETDWAHPVYAGLAPRHAAWHHHGVYTAVPPGARILQRSAQGEIVTWETTALGGALLVTTLDPIIEHAIQQIGHLDHYVDRLLAWLIGRAPSGRLVLDEASYGRWAPSAGPGADPSGRCAGSPG